MPRTTDTFDNVNTSISGSDKPSWMAERITEINQVLTTKSEENLWAAVLLINEAVGQAKAYREIQQHEPPLWNLLAAIYETLGDTSAAETAKTELDEAIKRLAKRGSD